MTTAAICVGLSKTMNRLFLLLLVSASAIAGIDDGLIAHFPFDGDTDDASGNAQHGVNHGVTFTADRNGATNRAAYFDEDSHYVEVWSVAEANQHINTSEGTICLWAKPEANVLWTTSGFAFKYFSNQDDRLYLDLSYYQLPQGNFLVGVGSGGFSSDGTIPRGEWHHVAVVWNSDGTIKAYLDGELDSEGTYGNPGFLFRGAETFNIGKGWSVNPGYYHGALDEFRIYDRALSAPEIMTLFEDKTTEQGAVIWME